MRHGQGLSVALALAVATVGCVAKDTYLSAVRESEEVRADLDREQSQTRALEQQLKSLQEQTGKLKDEAKLAAAEVQRLSESGDVERSGVEGRVKELDAKLKDMAAQNRSLKQQTEELRKRNAALETAVVRAQRDIKEQPRGGTALGGPGAALRPTGSGASSGPLAQGGPQAKPPGSAASAPPGAPGAPAQVAKAQNAPGGPPKAASPAKAAEPAPQEELGLVATIKKWLATIWHWIF